MVVVAAAQLITVTKAVEASGVAQVLVALEAHKLVAAVAV
jgi:hypothetical protein